MRMFVTLWFRLVSLGIVGTVFAEGLMLAHRKVQGWTFYLTTGEVILEVLVRLAVAALVGIFLGTLLSVLILPLLWYFKLARPRILQWATNAFVVLVLFLLTRYALITLIQWSGRGTRFIGALLFVYFVAFVVALCVARTRRELLVSLGGVVSNRGSRLIVAATLIVSLALAGTEFLFSRSSKTMKAAQATPRPKANIVLITFDALAADDMSLYGYRLPTTPNIDAFARQSTVFTNFYSVTTFTTPSIATMLTGGYLSETRVYQLQGSISTEQTKSTIAHLMRDAGYATGAFLTNPFAHYVSNGLDRGFDVLPEPVFQAGGLQRAWTLTRPLHQNSGMGSRVAEYQDLEGIWNSWFRLPGNLAMRYRPDAAFRDAGRVLDGLPDGFFLWVHVITPHHPYLPDEQDRGRFLPEAEGRTFQERSELQWVPHYAPDEQAQVDRRRLLYDEFLLSADRAFGGFISDLEKSGRLKNTTVIVSADHGESFEGGVFRHESPYLTTPTIHIPLIIRTPGQQQGHTVAFTADQTALAPTILEVAGVPKPVWMNGQSIGQWLTTEKRGDGQGLAFSQFFEKNSIFRPLRHGTVGVIDGEYQYVLDLDSAKGVLRPLSRAQDWMVDESGKNPGKAQQLLTLIYSRFPELRRNSK